MHLESNAKILINNSAWMYLAKITSQLLMLVATVLVINKLAIDVFGTYNLLLNSFVVFQILALSAVVNVFNRYIPELISNKEYKKLKKFIKGGFLLSSCLFLILTLLLFSFKEEFASFFKIPSFESFLLAFFAYSYSMFLMILMDETLKSMLLNKKVALITIFNTAIRPILYIIFLKKLDVNVLLYIEVVLSLIYLIQGIIVYLKFIRSLKDDEKNENINPVTYKRIRKYGLLSLFNELGVGVVNKTSDYFIVAAMSNPYNLGLFAFAHKIYSIIYKVLPFKDLQVVVRPIFIKKFIGDYEKKEFKKMFSFMIKILLPIYIFPALYFLFFGHNIITIFFGSKYNDAYLVTFIVLFSNFFMALFFPLTLTAQLKERMDIILYSKVVIVFSIIAGILGMKHFGIIGVALASVMGDFLKNMIIYFFMRRYNEVRYSIKDFKNYFIILIFLLPFIVFIFYKLNILLLTVFSLFFFIYLFLLFIYFNPFNDYDMKQINKIVESNKIVKTVYLKIYSIKIILHGD